MADRLSSKMKKYEVRIPVEETWIFHVYAESEKEAKQKVDEGEGEQVYTVSGRDNGVFEIKEPKKIKKAI